MSFFFLFAEKKLLKKSAFQTVIIWHRDKRGYTVQYDGVLHNHLDSWFRIYERLSSFEHETFYYQ